jgi:phosphoglycolate phosphatase
MIRAAIFDLDGTLVDSLPATVDAFNAVVAPFLGTRLTAKEVRGVHGPNYRKILGNFLPADRVDAGLKQLLGEVLKNAGRVAVFPGVPALLDDLLSRGCRLAVATLRDAESTARILEATGLKARFEHVLCGAEALGKGSGYAVDPAALQALVEKMACASDETAFVCDSAVDLETGRKAGLKTAAVAWGYQRREDLLVATPDFLFEPLT